MATCRSTVDLPAMLGPVSRHRRRRASSVILLGTKLAAPIMASTTGWRPSSMKMVGTAVQFGTAPAVAAPHLGKALPVVQMGDDVRHVQDALPLLGHEGAQILIELIFQRLAFFGSGKESFFQLLEGGRGEAFGIGQGLAADEMFRHPGPLCAALLNS